MLFAAINEFGVDPDDTIDVLNELSQRARTLTQSFPYEHHLIKTFGNTDLIEVSLFDHFRFADSSGSTAQSFRRSVGVRCPEAGDLLPDRPKNVCTAEELLGDKEDSRNFLAVVFLGLSPIPALCVPLDERPLAYRVVHDFCTRAFWSRFCSILRASCRRPPEVLEPLVAPLIGLDSVEVVLLVRASRLEQLSALAWAIHSQTLGDLWPAKANDGALHRARELLDLTGEAGLERLWDTCPLYRGARTVVGMRLRKPDEPNAKWRLDGPSDGSDEEDPPAAEAAVVFVHTKYLPGFKNPTVLLDQDGWADGKDRGEREDPKRGETSNDTDGNPTTRSFLFMFDQADVLWSVDVRGLELLRLDLARRRTVGEMRRLLGDISGLGDRPRVGIRPATEIAVWTSVPTDLLERSDGELASRLRGRLHDWRNMHLGEPGGWIRRWLSATQKKGVDYSTTNGVINVLATVLRRLDNSLEEQVDLLPILHYLVQAGENKRTDLAEIDWLAESAGRLVSSRGRRDDPLQLPTDTLALEGHAAYRLPRDAHMIFAESLAENREVLVLPREIPGGAWKLHDPLHWIVVPHEVAHAHLSNKTVEKLDPRTSMALSHMISELQGLQTDPKENLETVLRRIGERLRRQHRKALTFPFAEALASCLSEIAPDLFLWSSLKRAEDQPSETRRRFWFVHGPGLVFALLQRYGSKPLDTEILQAVILRCALLSFVVRKPVPTEKVKPWWDFLLCTLEQLDHLAPKMRLKGPSNRWDTMQPPDLPLWRGTLLPDEVPQVLTRLQCLKEDLRISDRSWRFAVRRQLDSLRYVLREDSRLIGFVDCWLDFVNTLPEGFGLDEESGEPLEIRHLYADYLQDLMRQWPRADPWPPFVRSHELQDRTLVTFRRFETDFGLALSRRGTVLVQNSYGDMEGQREYLRRTFHFLDKLAERARGRRYYKLFKYLQEPDQESSSSARS